MLLHANIVIDPDEVRAGLRHQPVFLMHIGAAFGGVGATATGGDFAVVSHHGLEGQRGHDIARFVEVPHGGQHVDADTGDARRLEGADGAGQLGGAFSHLLEREVEVVGDGFKEGDLVDHGAVLADKGGEIGQRLRGVVLGDIGAPGQADGGRGCGHRVTLGSESYYYC